MLGRSFTITATIPEPPPRPEPLPLPQPTPRPQSPRDLPNTTLLGHLGGIWPNSRRWVHWVQTGAV